MAKELPPPAVTNVAPVVDAPSTSAGDDAQAQGSTGRSRRSRPTRYACAICGRDPELEIRHLHEKIDHILTHSWERLAEIQRIQLEIMQDTMPRKR